MDDLLDLIIADESPSAISDKIKDILFSKTGDKIDELRPAVASSIFDPQNEDFVDSEEEG